jgi:hypothetical protein
MVIINFSLQIVWQSKNIPSAHNGDGMLSIIKFVATESISSPIVWQLKKQFDRRTFLDLGHLINNGLISTIDLVMEFGLPSNKM